MATTNIASDMTRQMGAAWVRQIGRRLVVIVSLVLVLLAAVAALILMRGINQQIEDVTHTYEVRNQARELTIALTEAESSQRGYLLTRDESYLDPYRQAATSIESRLLSLIAITQDDPAQAARVGSIARDIAEKSAEMAETVNLVENQRTAEARTLIQAGIGERVMDEVRATLERFIAEEDHKLLERNGAIDESRRWLVAALIAALTGAVVLTYSLFMRTLRQVSALAASRDLLTSENEMLEAHVRERTQAVEEARAHAEHERQRVEALLQDTNHRIGNSLATVSSLLGLQLLRSRSDEVREALEAARSRVHAIASAHRRLRLGDDLETASADEFLGTVIEDMEATAVGGSKVSVSGEIEPIVIGARDATTVGILVGELVTNALKHAFPDGRAGTITVRFKRDEAGVPTLMVLDDGVGIPEGAEPGEGGLGSVIVKQLATQLGGMPHYERRDGGGLSVTVPLPGIEGPPPQASPE